MAMMAPGKTASIQCDAIQRPMRASAPPRITALRAIPVAGRDSMLLNLSGAHGPFFVSVPRTPSSRPTLNLPTSCPLQRRGGEVDMDRQRLEQCLEQVVAYRASGLKATAWAAANGVDLRELQSWCAHSKRWRARLDGVALAPPPQPSGFVAVRASVAPSAPASCCIRVELGSGTGRVELHWPLSHARDLATWLREFSR